MAKLLLFDVNGTLLDMGVLDPHFAQLFGRAAARQEWFGLVQQLWMTDLLTHNYTPFNKLAEAALRMMVERWGLTNSQPDNSKVGQLVHAAADTLGIYAPTGEEAAILKDLKELPPFADAAPGLRLLQEAGFRMAALTNGAKSAAEAMLKKADLLDYFETVLSVETVKRFKPAPEAYALATRELNVAPTATCLVAAHAWDIAGASAVGWQTAFIRRPHQVLNPDGVQPNWQGDNLIELAQRLIQSVRQSA